MKKKESIAIIATNCVSLANFRGKLILSWVKRGYEVYCISIEPPEEFAISVGSLGVKYIQVYGTRTGIGFVSGLKMINAYRKQFDKIKPCYVYLYMSKPIAFGGVAALIARIPHVNVLINGLENAFYRDSFKDFIVRFVLSVAYKMMGEKAENVFLQNKDDYEYLKKKHILLRNNVHVINGSGVDMDYFTKKPVPDKPVFLMVARLLWSKGIREFLEAVPKLKRACPDSEILLVGGLDNNDEALTEDDLNKAVASYDIEYCGYCKDVRPYLERCSIFVLPSYHEGLSRSVLEAMATGRAIITTDAPGCRETVKEGWNGFLVPTHNSAILAERMIELAQNKKMRETMAENSYNFCKENYEINIVNNEINKVMFGSEF